MCGLNGIFAYNQSAPDVDLSELIAVRDQMAARGPDGYDHWVNSKKRVALGHRRLSIIDLDDSASQPMQSECGRYTIVFNGEIYNYQVLRENLVLQGARLRTNSDTEVLLQLFARKGISCVAELRGMFAFCVWDEAEQELTLCRDTYGIKPLYYSFDGWTFRFASQVKALLKCQKIDKTKDEAGVVGFLLWGSVPEPYTLYRHIRSLPAGHYMFVNRDGPSRPIRHKTVTDILQIGSSSTKGIKNAERLERTRQALQETIKAHLVADVDSAVFLSAGLDSSLILSFAAENVSDGLGAVTLTYPEYQNTADDETPVAQQMAAKCGAQHHISSISRFEFLEDLPQIIDAMDQPSIDGVNTWFVAKATKAAGYKIGLSGLGGDELFGGYPTYNRTPLITLASSPAKLVPGLGKLIHLGLKNAKLARENPKLPFLGKYGGSLAGAYFLQRALFLPEQICDALDPITIERGLREVAPVETIRQKIIREAPRNKYGRYVAMESSLYMRNQLLRDADWAGMAHGVEIRTPFVDAMLLEQLSPILSGSDLVGPGKPAIGALLRDLMPSEVLHRPKTGFTIPIQDWVDREAGCNSTRGNAARAWALDILHKFDREVKPAK